MKKQILSILSGVLLVFLILGTASASYQFTSVMGSTNPSSTGIAQDLASSQYVANAIGQKYGSASFKSIVDSALTSSIEQNSQMNIIVFGGPVSNSVTKQLVSSGKSKVNWATSNGQTEAISNAWGTNTAKVFIVAGKNRAATEKACIDFANQIKAGNVAFIGSTPTPITTTYTIYSSAGTGGSIYPNGTISVTNGSSQTFTITPNSDYEISDVLVDGVSQGKISSYTFTNVNTYHYISASFTPTTTTYTISTYAYPSSYGSITPTTDVSSGSSFTVTATANALSGRYINSVNVDGSTTTYGPGTTSYSKTFYNIEDDHSVFVQFA